MRNSDAATCLMKVVNGQLAEIARYTGFGSASSFAGIAAGNLDGQPGDEIAVARNFDGGIFALKLVGGSTDGRRSGWRCQACSSAGAVLGAIRART